MEKSKGDNNRLRARYRQMWAILLGINAKYQKVAHIYVLAGDVLTC
jgi:hypothetical protein